MKAALLILLFLLINLPNTYGAEPRFSGEPLPRFAALAREHISSRVGPSIKYPVKYEYHSKFQPVQIINEYYGWYQIKDKTGDISWVHKSQISKNSYAITIYNKTKLYAKPKLTAEILAFVDKGAIFRVGECSSGFCEVDTNFNNIHYSGYILTDNLWGV